MQMPLPLSYTKLSDYEKCPAAAAYKHIHRLPTPKSPALTRGIGVHADGENWMRAAKPGPLPGLYVPFGDDMKALKKGGALPEVTLLVNEKWEPVAERSGAFLIAKLDLLYVSGPFARVIDYKTGKPYDTHRDQGIVYTLATWAHHPEVQEVQAEFWYLDVPEARDLLLRVSNQKGLKSQMTRRLIKIVEDREFKPTPSDRACKWCDFHAKKGGPCKAGA